MEEQNYPYTRANANAAKQNKFQSTWGSPVETLLQDKTNLPFPIITAINRKSITFNASALYSPTDEKNERNPNIKKEMEKTNRKLLSQNMYFAHPQKENWIITRQP